jgi:hypothetical protein
MFAGEGGVDHRLTRRSAAGDCQVIADVGVNLKGADLTGVEGLTDVQIASVEGNVATRLP